MNIERNSNLFNLFETYKNLLTDNQQKILEMFVGFDNTLAEIAEELGVSRQSVFNTISDAEKMMNDYESKLHLLEKNTKTKDALQKMADKLEKNNLKEYANRIQKIVNNM